MPEKSPFIPSPEEHQRRLRVVRAAQAGMSVEEAVQLGIIPQPSAFESLDLQVESLARKVRELHQAVVALKRSRP